MDILLQPILIPAILGLIAILLPKIKYVKEALSFIGSAYLLGVSIFIYTQPELTHSLGTLSIADFATKLGLRSFHFSSVILMFIFLFGTLIALYSWKYQEGSEQNNKYYAFFMWTLAAAAGIVLSDSLFLVLIFWEFSTLMLAFLIGLANTEASSKAATKSLIILGFSDLCFLLAVALVWVNFNVLSLQELSIATGGGTSTFIYILFLIAALAKAGAMPLHSWVVDAAKHSRTTVAAFLPASLDKLLGIYFLARITHYVFTIGDTLQTVVMTIGGVTIIAAVMMALIQHDLKKLLGFHAVSQVGYMVLGIGTGTAIGVVGGLFHMINNTLYKSCLFLGAGSVEKQTGTTDLESLGGLAKMMPLTFIAMAISAVSIAGVPPFNGFTSKWMVYQSLMKHPIFLILAVFGSALTLASFIKVLYSVFLGSRPVGLDKVKDPSWSMVLPMLILAGGCVFFGVFAQFPVGNLLGPVANIGTSLNITGTLSFANTLWNPTSATLLILVGFVMGLLVYIFMGKALKFRESSVYTCGEKLSPERAHYSGTNFYKSIKDLKFLKGMYRDGSAGVYDLFNIVNKLFGESLVKVLKKLHSGVLSSYISWLIIGLVAVLFFLIR